MTVLSSKNFPLRNVLGISCRKTLSRVSVWTRVLQMRSKATSNQQFSAPYKPLNSDMVELNQKETLFKYQALNRSPVTPVRVEQLECLLHCYEQSKKNFLVDGFALIMLVTGFVLNLLILKVSETNLKLLKWNCTRNAKQVELWSY